VSTIPLREFILKVPREEASFTASDIVRTFPRKISRQYAHRILRQLVEEGKLIRGGSTRGAFYALPEQAEQVGLAVKLRLQNRGLQEDAVLDELRARLPPLNTLKRNVNEIFAYAFLEIMNNAIEHSESARIDVEIQMVRGQAKFVVEDYGIGVFRKVMSQRRLGSELEAIQDLLKGKTTTAPAAHSGEGIFFTSKVADVFDLDSFGRRLRVDNLIDDVFIVDAKPLKRGTKATFSMAKSSTRELRDVFQRFASEPTDPSFDTSEVKVKVYSAVSGYVSRSEARRMLSGLDKFRTVTLDFQGVQAVGQSFVDQVFRVFPRQHPDIVLRPINMDDPVAFMVERAKRSS